jgi:hypothetical protein
MTAKKPTSLILICCLIFSCTSLRRYNSAEICGTDNSLADVSLFGLKLADAHPASSAKTLWDLSADAQSQFIKILNNRFPDNTEFLRAMNLEYVNSFTDPLPSGLLTKDLRLVLSVSKQRGYTGRTGSGGAILSPADRIEYLKLTLRLPDSSGLHFRYWNHFSTEYGTIDIGGVSFSRSLDANFSGENSTETGIRTSDILAGAKTTLLRKEEQQIRYRYILLNGRIRDNQLEAEEEGTREIDLTGNLLADVSLGFDGVPLIVSRFQDLTDSSGRFNPPRKITLRTEELSVPVTPKHSDTIFAVLNMDYVFRCVSKGQRTFQEWDDHVKYYKGTVSRQVALMTAGDYVPQFFLIGDGKAEYESNLISISANGKSFPIVFRSGQEADSFLKWMSSHFSHPENALRPVSISGFKFILHTDTLNGSAWSKNNEIRVIPFLETLKTTKLNKQERL